MKLPSHFYKIAKEIELQAYYMPSPYMDFPCEYYDDGDNILFNGLLASVNYPLSRQSVYECQSDIGGKRGMFYRSPNRRGNDNKGFSHFFSRDMSLGVLCAFATSYFDKSPEIARLKARRWVQYIDKNRACLVTKPWGKGCLVRSPFWRFAPDDRSDITPNMWSMMYHVWESQGWEPTSKMKKYKDAIFSQINIWAAERGEDNYKLHLKVVQTYILKYLCGIDRPELDKIFDIARRRCPKNPFYRFLAFDRLDRTIIDLMEELAPNTQRKITGDKWMFEHPDPRKYKEKSCGWDWLFVAKLIDR